MVQQQTFDQIDGDRFLNTVLGEPWRETICLHFDGGCSPNPGNKYGSFETEIEGQKICGRSRVAFGPGTNNEAEFNALELGLIETLQALDERGQRPKDFSLLIVTDSKIVRNRMAGNNFTSNGRGAETSRRMFALAKRCLDLTARFGKVSTEWEGRESNVERFGH